MQSFLTFASQLFGTISSFLLSEPVVWFVGVFLVLFVAGLVKRIIS